MLIPVVELVADHGLTDVRGVVHLGAHFGEEADAYDRDIPWAGRPRVVWVEGDDTLLGTLHSNVDHRPGHTVVAAFVDDDQAEATFHLASNDGASSSLLVPGTHLIEHPQIRFTTERQVTTMTVDSLAASLGWGDVNFLCLDLQGAELRALEGAAGFLDHVDFVFSEVYEAELYVGCPMVADLDAHLDGFDRVVTCWTPNGWGDALWVRR